MIVLSEINNVRHNITAVERQTFDRFGRKVRHNIFTKVDDTLILAIGRQIYTQIRSEVDSCVRNKIKCQ